MIFISAPDGERLATLNNESPQACPYWADIHKESIQDSLSTYQFEAPLDHSSSEHLIADNYITRADMDGYLIEFKIKKTDEIMSSNGIYSKRVFCENSAISELNGHIIRPKVMPGYTADDALFYVLNGSGWEKGECDYLGAKDFEFKDYETGIAAVHAIAKAFGGELRYRVSRNRKTGKIRKFVDLLESRGTDTGKRFEYAKDITGLTRTEDTTSLATALIGLGKADNNGKRMTISSANNDQDWVGDEDALDRYGTEGRHIFGVYTSDTAENPTVLLAETKRELNIRKKPLFTYEVNVILLETLADWSHEEVRLGDTVRVKDLQFNPNVVLSARIVSLDRSYVDPTQDKAILGEYRPLRMPTPAIVKQMQRQLISNEGMLQGREPMIHIGPLPPSQLDQKWMDTSVVPNVLKRWDGTEWVAAGGEQGPPGPAGPTLYTWVKYADDELGNGLSNNPLNKKYIGIAYNQTTSTESTNPSLYMWSLLTGQDGAQGIQGPQGVDGRSQYLHIAYANNKTGTLDFSITDATNKAYIGTYSDFLEDDSTDPAMYTWALIKGETGQQGPPGVSSYTYIRYSQNVDGSPMTANPDGNTRYIGFAVVQSSTAPTANTAYTWSLYQGPQGIQGLQGLQGDRGDQGLPGADGTSSYTHIAYATGTSGQNFSVAHFSTATYIGIYVDNRPEDSTDYTKYKWTLIKGADGTQGIPGPKGEDGKTPYFHTAWATNETGTSGFSTTVSLGKTYIGTYTDYVATDSTDPAKYKWALIQGPKGDQGIQGVQGPKGSDGQTLYTWVKYADTPTQGMSDLPAGKVYIGLAYNKITPTESMAYEDYSWSLIKGADGPQGPVGPNGETLYTWIKYADTPTTGMSDSPAGRRYMGIAYNKTTATESTNYSDYNWSPLYDNVKVGTRNYVLNGDVEKRATNLSLYELNIDVGELNGKPVTVSFDGKKDAGSPAVNMHAYFRSPTAPVGSDSNYMGDLTTEWKRYSLFIPAETGRELASHISIHPNIADAAINIKNINVGMGNVESDFTPSIEDIDAKIGDKAPISDLDNLATIVATVSSNLNHKAGAGELEAMRLAWNERVNQDILDKEQLALDLNNIEKRAILAETIAGDAKIVTNFIDTVITESEEGIYLSNKGNSTGILIGTDRISFLDGDVEVAYISNQTMQINHGIFVESATIANYKFELIPGTQILAIQWVGG